MRARRLVLLLASGLVGCSEAPPAVSADLAAPADFAPPPDLASPADLAAPDLAAPPDSSIPLDLAPPAADLAASDARCPSMSTPPGVPCGGPDGGCVCPQGYADCNRDPRDGCERNLLTDVQSCGACGLVCPINLRCCAACANGACNIGGCTPGFIDCNCDPRDGCEINVATDPKNCGACDHACPNGGPCVQGICR